MQVITETYRISKELHYEPLKSWYECFYMCALRFESAHFSAV
jgi:hypothetical protein